MKKINSALLLATLLISSVGHTGSMNCAKYYRMVTAKIAESTNPCAAEEDEEMKNCSSKIANVIENVLNGSFPSDMSKSDCEYFKKLLPEIPRSE